ncbi:unnamed protein product [Microthlaspi erraticum]|uniref:Uncharacterized protein n=1 Tax=Microthlaspi erraticum TaxID=1685480 RepID=A0A6D2KZJ8_9BRAS|nr:unnamed protein product [Microthlaspi erraticum]
MVYQNGLPWSTIMVYQKVLLSASHSVCVTNSCHQLVEVEFELQIGPLDRKHKNHNCRASLSLSTGSLGSYPYPSRGLLGMIPFTVLSPINGDLVMRPAVAVSVRLHVQYLLLLVVLMPSSVPLPLPQLLLVYTPYENQEWQPSRWSLSPTFSSDAASSSSSPDTHPSVEASETVPRFVLLGSGSLLLGSSIHLHQTARSSHSSQVPSSVWTP